jgi:hypothetical protein
MSPKMKLVVDIAERVVFTYLAAFVGLLATSNLRTLDGSTAGKTISFLSVAQLAAVSALPAMLTLIKSGLSSLAGNHNTAAALPGALDNGA